MAKANVKKVTKVVEVQPRWKSIPLWTAMAALIYLVVKSWFGIEIPNWAEISSLAISIAAIIFGVANNTGVKGAF